MVLCVSVVYDSCPRSFASGIWWDRQMVPPKAEHGQSEVPTQDIQECPEGTKGDAVRNCTQDGWLQPDLSLCTSTLFIDLAKEVRGHTTLSTLLLTNKP